VNFERTRRRALLVLAAALVAGTAAPAAAAGPGKPAGSYTIKGSGASFPAPAYSYWISKFRSGLPGNVDANMQYAAVGSGTGISDFRANRTDYGASDAPMTSSEMSGNGWDTLHVPSMIGPVALGVRLTCVSSVLLTGQNVGDLFSGAITRWNDPKLRTGGRNAGLADCDVKVTPVHRSDSSGTTYAFTAYLKQSTNSYWRSRSSLPSKQPSWPVGVGAPRNAGVALKVKSTPGAIGYMELSYATTASLIKARIQNPRGAFVSPSASAATAAANAKLGDVPGDLRIDPVISASCTACYPIVSYTFWLVREQSQASADETSVTLAYFYWGLTTGQNYLASLGYAKLPTAVRTKAINQLHKVKVGGEEVWP